MTKEVLKFIREQAAKLDLEGPVVEFGSFQVPSQVGFADIRPFFGDLEFTGCDLEPGPGVDLIDDMEHSHFPPSSVGTVVCLETLEHVQHPWIAVKEAYRILKPGGTCIVSMPFRHGIHNHPDDYWRMTASGLEVLFRQAGFEDVETWDSREELIEGYPYPFCSFGVARKQVVDSGRVSLSGSLVIERMDGYRKSPIAKDKTVVESGRPRPVVPIVVPLFGREEETRLMFDQLERVTEGYSIVLVDNGFGDEELIRSLAPGALIRNGSNVGITAAVNQGLGECTDAPYVGVLHSDALIFEEGWLDHVVEFMETRPDVGVVCLCGRHGIREDGSLDLETTVFLQERFPRCFKPTWRFSEVAALDGFAFVMRNIGLSLDESLGMMHYYDLDLSMQYIEAGYRIYAVGIDCKHLAGFERESSRADEDYLRAVGGDDDAFYEEVRERFRRKWQHMLPIVRGFQDEAYPLNRLEDLILENEELNSRHDELEAEVERRGDELSRADDYARRLEAIIHEFERHARNLEAELEVSRSAPRPDGEQEIPADGAPSGNLGKLRYYLAEEGAASTARRAGSYLRRKAKRQ